MLLPPEDSKLFFKLYKSLLRHTNAEHSFVPDFDPDRLFSGHDVDALAKLRAKSLEPEPLADFASAGTDVFEESELEIVHGWVHAVTGKLLIMRYLKKYTVFMTLHEPLRLYGVLALQNEIADVMRGTQPPILVDAALVPFRGQIVYEGLLFPYGMTFVSGMRAQLNRSDGPRQRGAGAVDQLG